MALVQLSRKTPPDTVVVGSPAGLVKFPRDVETIQRNEAALYPPVSRIPAEVLNLVQGRHSGSFSETAL